MKKDHYNTRKKTFFSNILKYCGTTLSLLTNYLNIKLNSFKFVLNLPIYSQ